MPSNTPALAWLRTQAEGTDDNAGHARAVLAMVAGLEQERDALLNGFCEFVNERRGLAAAISRGDDGMKKRYGWLAAEALDARHPLAFAAVERARARDQEALHA